MVECPLLQEILDQPLCSTVETMRSLTEKEPGTHIIRSEDDTVAISVVPS